MTTLLTSFFSPDTVCHWDHCHEPSYNLRLSRLLDLSGSILISPVIGALKEIAYHAGHQQLSRYTPSAQLPGKLHGMV